MSKCDEDLRNRVDELVAWARSRIAHCRAAEAKFSQHTVRHRVAIETVDIIAARERMTLQAVLAHLGVQP